MAGQSIRRGSDKWFNSSLKHNPKLALVLVVSFFMLFIIVYAIFNYNNERWMKNNTKTLYDMEDLRLAASGRAGTLSSMVISDSLVNVNEIFVIPGGGSSTSNLRSDVNHANAGYPEWTRRRVISAFKDYEKHDNTKLEKIFLTLSAGSLNSPNMRYADGRIIFECQHMIQHLKDLGVPKEAIFGDYISWDTVSNALVVRMLIDGILALKKENGIEIDSKTPPLTVSVYISDFHAERVKAAFSWVLDVAPSRLPFINFIVNSVNSEGIEWGSKELFEKRRQHELNGVEVITRNSNTIKTIEQLYAFLLLGAHKGYYNYMHGSYTSSKGAGW